LRNLFTPPHAFQISGVAIALLPDKVFGTILRWTPRQARRPN
jgi:hypothetical protein